MIDLLTAIRLGAAAIAGIHGAVRASGTGAPAIGAHVQLDGIEQGVTDSAGRYAFSGLPAGQHEFRFVASGFEARRITVILVDGSDLALDVELTRAPVPLPSITVTAKSFRVGAVDSLTRTAVAGESGHYRFGQGWQADQLAGGTDLQRLLGSVPGIAWRGDNPGALSVRGGQGSENMVLLDGIPLLGASHFASASSGVNPDAIATVDVHTGVNSVRYDGALSGVIELHTADSAPPRLRAAGSATVSDVRSLIEAPLGKGGLLVGVRASFRDLLTDSSGFGVSNGYEDAIAVGHLPLGRGTLRLVSFGSGNRMRWESFGGNDGSSTDGGTVIWANSANWSSGAIGATWAQPVGMSASWHTAAWWSGSHALISSTGTTQAQYLDSGISEFGLSSELRRGYRFGTLVLGTELTRSNTWYHVTTPPALLGDSAATIAINTRPVLGSAYGEWSWRPAVHLGIQAGLRANSDFAGRLDFAPRITMSLDADSVTKLEFGVGRTHQSTQSMLNEENITSTIISPALPVAAAPNGPIARADEWELSLSRQLGRATVLSLDGYLRSWHDVLTPAASTTGYFVSTTPSYGDGRAQGLLASITTSRPSWSLRTTAGLTSSIQRTTSGSYHVGSEQPWSWSGDLTYHAFARTTLQLHWATGAGQPATAILPTLEWTPYNPASGSGEIEGIASNLPGAVNALRLPMPLRLDLGIRHVWSVGPSSGHGGISTTLRVVNLLNRANPIGLVARPDGSLQLLSGSPRGVVFELGWIY